MKDNKEKIVLLTLNDNSKVEGILIKIDKENLKIILDNGKITFSNGTVETFTKREISKSDIKEIRLIEEKEKEKEKEKIDQEKKESKPILFNEIPLNIQEKYAKEGSKYNKDGFFDSLTISNNTDNLKEIRTYNDKNTDTFGAESNHFKGSWTNRKKKYNNNNNQYHNYKSGYNNDYNSYGNKNKSSYNTNSNYNYNQYGNSQSQYNNNGYKNHNSNSYEGYGHKTYQNNEYYNN